MEFDPTFCHFCQDALPAGKMLLVIEGTQDVVGTTDFGVCPRCALDFTDRRVAENPETGQYATFQFEHEQFQSPETQAAIETLTRQIEKMVCHVCNKAVDRNSSEKPSIPPRDFAIKMLRMHPEAHFISVTCADCSSMGICPCCKSKDED